MPTMPPSLATRHAMSILVIQIPARAAPAAPRRRRRRRRRRRGLGTEYAYVAEPRRPGARRRRARCARRCCPRPTRVVAVLADTDVSWHRITLPKAPAARLRAALVGVLEEALLDDADDVHLAVAPDAAAGQPTWVAAVDRPLAARRTRRAREGRRLRRPRRADRRGPTIRRAATSPRRDRRRRPAPGRRCCTWAHADGVASVRLQGGLARALVPQPGAAGDALERHAGAPPRRPSSGSARRST